MRNMLLFRRSLLLACFLFASAFCFAQVTEKWVNRENGDATNSSDVANALAVDNKNNVYVTGRSFGFSGMSKSGAGFSSYQFIIPKLAHYGLNLAAGETVGIYVLIEGYGTLLEPDDYLTVTLGKNPNSITTRHAINVNGTVADNEAGYMQGLSRMRLLNTSTFNGVAAINP